eukprot:CAMPEP_0202475998 /NCGR_PEP_ID=MMETSP1360-20130828/93188_1 /ASSEMBLY_ACC=CAM_ASM_000848 /TAXON_ID=515479 /ORGANISM="Licmophora paradoxa, Strain CCMP2313" /LENGTH=629 /DNA_ID=CAMNT_0049103181 /DNA_START=225 /DNA_END=2114 /DNA_ORIENTATION=+
MNSFAAAIATTSSTATATDEHEEQKHMNNHEEDQEDDEYILCDYSQDFLMATATATAVVSVTEETKKEEQDNDDHEKEEEQEQDNDGIGSIFSNSFIGSVSTIEKKDDEEEEEEEEEEDDDDANSVPSHIKGPGSQVDHNLRSSFQTASLFPESWSPFLALMLWMTLAFSLLFYDRVRWTSERRTLIHKVHTGRREVLVQLQRMNEIYYKDRYQTNPPSSFRADGSMNPHAILHTTNEIINLETLCEEYYLFQDIFEPEDFDHSSEYDLYQSCQRIGKSNNKSIPQKQQQPKPFQAVTSSPPSSSPSSSSFETPSAPALPPSPTSLKWQHCTNDATACLRKFGRSKLHDALIGFSRKYWKSVRVVQEGENPTQYFRRDVQQLFKEVAESTWETIVRIEQAMDEMEDAIQKAVKLPIIEDEPKPDVRTSRGLGRKKYLTPPPEQLEGTFRRHPIENPWHDVSISFHKSSNNNNNTLVWSNKAGISWNLELTKSGRSLLLNDDCPYYMNGQRHVEVEVESMGKKSVVVTALIFQEERYVKEEDTPTTTTLPYHSPLASIVYPPKVPIMDTQQQQQQQQQRVINHESVKAVPVPTLVPFGRYAWNDGDGEMQKRTHSFTANAAAVGKKPRKI